MRATRRRLYGARMTSPKPARLLAAAALLALLAACGDADPQATPTTPPPATSAAPSLAAVRDPAMCANIQTAFNAWSDRAPRSAAEVAAMDGAGMTAAMHASDELLKAVEGHEDPNSKILALAVASYGLVLANANMILANTGELDDGRAEQVAGKAEEIRSTHANLQGISCFVA